ncbi:MAG: uracil-DNA glycosylase [Deltaproteobacteria bacterium]|nr:uracil-DNA glycosylase [Deltaproteobacteria bacterium]
MSDNSKTDLIKDIRSLLKYQKSLGIDSYPRTEGLQRFLEKREQPSAPSPPSRKYTRLVQVKAAIETREKHVFDPGLAKKATLADVRQELGDCTRCNLHKGRTNIVFGQGSEQAKLMVIGPAPSAEDDHGSAPFLGASGDLLTKMLAAIGLSREDVYLTSLVKCFPAGGQPPKEEEIRTCLPFLFRQIEIICPTVICAMGKQPAQTLLHSKESLFRLRGRFYDFNSFCSTELAEKMLIIPTLHPTFLLDNEEMKKASWQDLQMIQKKI